MNINLLNIIPRYIIFFLPLILITGPFLSDLCLVFIGLFGIYKIFNEKIYYIFKNKFFIISGIWCIYIIFNSSLSEYPLLSYETSLFFFRYIFGIIGIKIFFDSEFDNGIIRKVFKLWSLVFLIIFVDSLIQYFFNYNILLFEKPLNRVSSFFLDEYILGAYLFKLYPVFLYICFNIKKELFSKYFLIVSILFSIVIFISGEREALLRFLLLFFLIGFYFFPLRQLLKFIPIFLILIISINLIDNSSFKRVIMTSLDQMKNKDAVFYTQGHTYHIVAAIELFKQKPFFGHGLKTFREKCKTINTNYCSTHPHNIFFQLLAEVGVFGLLFYLILLLFLIVKIINCFKLKQKNIIAILYLGIFVSIIPIFPNSNLLSNWNAVLLSITPGFLLYEYYKK